MVKFNLERQELGINRISNSPDVRFDRLVDIRPQFYFRYRTLFYAKNRPLVYSRFRIFGHSSIPDSGYPAVFFFHSRRRISGIVLYQIPEQQKINEKTILILDKQGQIVHGNKLVTSKERARLTKQTIDKQTK